MNKYQKELRAKVEQGPSFLERLDEDVHGARPRGSARRGRRSQPAHLGGGLNRSCGRRRPRRRSRNRSNGLLHES